MSFFQVVNEGVGYQSTPKKGPQPKNENGPVFTQIIEGTNNQGFQSNKMTFDNGNVFFSSKSSGNGKSTFTQVINGKNCKGFQAETMEFYEDI